MIYRSFILILFFAVSVTITSTSTAEPDKLWSDVSTSDVPTTNVPTINSNQANKRTQARSSAALPLLPDTYRLLRLNEAKMRDELTSANPATTSRVLARRSAGQAKPEQTKYNRDTKTLEIPLPDGSSLLLQVKPSKTMTTVLSAKYPSIKTYTADSQDNNGIYGAIDITQQGFHAMLFMADGKRLFIDPRQHAKNDTFYISYYDKDYHPAEKKPLICTIEGHHHKQTSARAALDKILKKTASRAGDSLRTYRLAMAATAEYTDFHGGTVAGALSAITTTISRVNVIYQRDLAVKLELIANTDLLISTNSADYSNFDGTKMLEENQLRTEAIIGFQNYDIGHVVSTGGGGIARLAATCGKNKARGVTGNSQPVGDAFDIDFVAHEIGHQMGGRHTFNSESGNCGGGNRTADLAVEPGSGSSILAYAGLCGANDLQPHTDAAFHIKSIEEITAFVNDPNFGGSCGTATALNNQQPTANAGSNYIIPPNTPFELTGKGSDPDQDIISYSWEQIDIGDPSDINVDTSNNSLFRTFLPTDSPIRVFPRLDSLLEGKTTSHGEILPTGARSLNFALAVRDGNGGVASDTMRITVSSSAAFKITSHGATETFAAGDITDITWNVGNTNTAPINCSNVNILLSNNGGKTFTNVSGGATPNDGSQSITLPASIADSTTARFKVKCDNNIFFDLSDADLTLKARLSAKTPLLSNTGSNAIADPGESIQLTIPLRNNITETITNLSGTLSSTAQGINPLVANSVYPDILPNTQANNTTAYQISIPASAACQSDFPISLATSYTLGSPANTTFDLTIPLGIGTQTQLVNQPIPDNNSVGVVSQVTVTGFGSVPNPEINLDVDITHPFRGDMLLELTSPQGTTVKLSSFDGRNSGVNLVGNFPADFSPEQSLSAFDGEDLDGIWQLKVADSATRDTGTFNSWSLHFKSSACDGKANSTPIASNSSLTTLVSTAFTGILQASDADNNPLIYSLISNGTKGTATIPDAASPTFTYTPITGLTGTDSFTFTASDGTATSTTATVNITIKPNTLNDGDSDGSENLDEGAVPDSTGVTTGDGNGDTIQDNTQSFVTSFKANDALNWITIANPAKNPQSNFITHSAPLSVPADNQLTLGTTQFDIATFVGERLTIEIYVTKDEAIRGYLLLGNDGVWTAQNTVITQSANKTKVIFNVTEGGNFDRDGISNGVLQLAQGGVMVKTGFDVQPFAYLYGKVDFGRQTIPKTFTVQNTGSRVLTIGTVEITGNNASEFAILSDNCSNKSLLPNGTCAIGASFRPTTIGSKSALLQIATDDPDNAVTQVFLSNHEGIEEETTRRIPPILSAVRILDSANELLEPTENLKANAQYSIEWTISGYHPIYSSSLALFNCTGIAEGSCGANLSDRSRFLQSGNINSHRVTNGLFSTNGMQSKDHQFSHTFTTPSFATNTPIVIRLYRLNGSDNKIGNNGLPLLIPGGHDLDFYDKPGQRIKSIIAP